MDKIKNNIGKNIRSYRLTRGVSQKTLATKIGVGGSAVSNWENGVNSIDIDTLYRVCRVLGVELNDMLGIEGEHYSAEEKELVLGWRALDDIARRVVRSVINIEGQRKIKIKIPIAARDGGKSTHTVDISSDDLKTLKKEID